MRILFAGKQHFEVGGIERNTDQLARRLGALGHDVAVVAPPKNLPPLMGSGRRGGVEPLDMGGYRVWVASQVSPEQALHQVLERWRPDVVVVNAGGRWFHDWTRGLVRAARDRIPCVLFLHDTFALELLDEPMIEPQVVWGCADTKTVAAWAAGFTAITVPPLVEPDLYRTEPTGEVVLFVNPVTEKGVRVAITLAASRPDIPFVFLRSWNLPPRYLHELQGMAASLGNVEVTGPVDDAREHYARTRLLLAPYDDLSRPRVVTEAQVSGIPALAYDDEGFREVVGAGGILVPREAGIGGWLRGLGVLWDDDEAHRRYSAAARERVERDDVRPEVIVARVEESLRDARERFWAKRRRPAPAGAPLVSVLVPVHQGAATINQQLEALTHQTYGGD